MESDLEDGGLWGVSTCFYAATYNKYIFLDISKVFLDVARLLCF